MKLLKNVRKIVLVLAFVSVGVFGYFQVNAAAPDDDCIEVAEFAANLFGWDISDYDDYVKWNRVYFDCLEW